MPRLTVLHDVSGGGDGGRRFQDAGTAHRSAPPGGLIGRHQVGGHPRMPRLRHRTAQYSVARTRFIAAAAGIIQVKSLSLA